MTATLLKHVAVKTFRKLKKNLRKRDTIKKTFFYVYVAKYAHGCSVLQKRNNGYAQLSLIGLIQCKEQ